MRKLILFSVFILICVPVFAGSGSYEKISISQMPNAFFGNWYNPDNGVWLWGVTNENFRTGNIFYDYDLIMQNKDGSYLCIFYHHTGCRAYLITFLSNNIAKYRSLPDGKWHTLIKKGN